jgi:sugar/nucleoside kinase (ribokinase family)
MPDIVCLGEALCDMVSASPGMGLVDSSVFEKAAGGAPTNVAAGIGILGCSAGLIAKVGDDHFGQFIRNSLADSDVDLENFILAPDYATQLAFVAVDPGGVPTFAFHVKQSADQMLTPEEIKADYVSGAGIFHFGSITLINEPCRSATHHALEIALDAGSLISFDPNLRPPLWPDLDTARNMMLETIPDCDLLKVSEQEAEFLTGREDIEEAAQHLYGLGPSLVAITRGGDGCYFLGDTGHGYVPGFEVPVDDTVGCGDAFVAGMLVYLLESEHDISELTLSELEELFRFANATGALTATGKGAIPAMPHRDEVMELLEG